MKHTHPSPSLDPGPARTRCRPLVIVAAILAIALAACSEAAATGVPNVVGMDLPAAQEALAEAGYTNVTTRRIDADQSIQGYDRDYDVVAQTPAAGSEVAKDSAILLDVTFRGLASPAP